MKHAKICSLLTVVLAIAGPVTATTVIDFEDWTPIDPYTGTSQGFSFHNVTSVSTHLETNNPTNCLYSSSGGFKFARVTPPGVPAEPFSILSLDLQEGFGAGDTRSVGITAHIAGGSVVQQTFTLDGDVATFQTFYPVGFSNVIQVSVQPYDALGQPTSGFSVDNIVVPEPATLGLILLGLGILRRRRRQT